MSEHKFYLESCNLSFFNDSKIKVHLSQGLKYKKKEKKILHFFQFFLFLSFIFYSLFIFISPSS